MINIIVAYDENRGIGYRNKLPWNIPEDLEFFQKLTTGHTVIMGSNTWKSLPVKPLPNRENIVLELDATKRAQLQREYSEIVIHSNLAYLMEKCSNSTRQFFIAGGGQIYKSVLNLFVDKIDQVYTTLVYGMFQCDTFFPSIPTEKHWWEHKELDYGHKDFERWLYIKRER